MTRSNTRRSAADTSNTSNDAATPGIAPTSARASPAVNAPSVLATPTITSSTATATDSSGTEGNQATGSQGHGQSDADIVRMQCVGCDAHLKHAASAMFVRCPRCMTTFSPSLIASYRPLMQVRAFNNKRRRQSASSAASSDDSATSVHQNDSGTTKEKSSSEASHELNTTNSTVSVDLMNVTNSSSQEAEPALLPTKATSGEAVMATILHDSSDISATSNSSGTLSNDVSPTHRGVMPGQVTQLPPFFLGSSIGNDENHCITVLFGLNHLPNTLIYQMRRDSPFSEVSLKYSEWQHVPLHLVRVLKNGRVLDGAQTLMSAEVTPLDILSIVSL